jgi:hypothetical protein
MKLYTEEQVRQSLNDNFNFGDRAIDFALSKLTPIELPSDEEIETYANFAFPYTEEKRGDNYVAYRGMKIGAKWVIEQIKQQVIGH